MQWSETLFVWQNLAKVVRHSHCFHLCGVLLLLLLFFHDIFVCGMIFKAKRKPYFNFPRCVFSCLFFWDLVGLKKKVNALCFHWIQAKHGRLLNFLTLLLAAKFIRTFKIADKDYYSLLNTHHANLTQMQLLRVTKEMSVAILHWSTRLPLLYDVRYMWR